MVQIGEKLKNSKLQSVQDIEILQGLQIPMKGPKQRFPRLVRWSRPSAGRMKLNVDECQEGTRVLLVQEVFCGIQMETLDWHFMLLWELGLTILRN